MRITGGKVHNMLARVADIELNKCELVFCREYVSTWYKLISVCSLPFNMVE
jgi:hypothetical protein